MKPETKKMERWLMRNRLTNDFAAYWWPKMRDAEDKDAVAEEVRESWECVRSTLLSKVEEMRERWLKARRFVVLAAERWHDMTWFTHYADDLTEPEEDVFV